MANINSDERHHQILRPSTFCQKLAMEGVFIFLNMNLSSDSEAWISVWRVT